MRIGGVVLGNGIRAIYRGAVEFLFMDTETSVLAHRSPWGYPAPDKGEKAFVVHTAVFMALRIICILPLLWLAFRSFKGFFGQTVFLLLAFLTLSGWPPPIVDLFFWAASGVAEWPMSYFLFGQRLHNVYDFATIGYICLLAIYLSHARIKRWWEIVGMVIFGQLIYENNGITCGVALFIYTLMEADFGSLKCRLVIAAQRISIAAATSFALALCFAWNIEFVSEGRGMEGPALTPLGNIIEYFRQYWKLYGFFNFSWLNVTIANFITVVSIPAIFGSCLGAVSGWARRKAKYTTITRFRTEFNAAFASVCGFGSTLVIGLFVSGLSSDMGRQVLPLTLMVLLAAAKFSEYRMGKRFVPQTVPAREQN